MPDLIPDPGLSFDEALVIDAVLKLAGELDDRFSADAIVNQARRKVWTATMELHKRDPAAYEAARERFIMSRRMMFDE